MKYYIKTETEQGGKILGFYTSQNKPKNKILIEVSNADYIQGQNHQENNTITVENKNITFSKANYTRLDDAKNQKEQELQAKFNQVSVEPITINNISYYGGYDSAQKLDAKRRLIVESGGTEVNFFDTDRVYHSHTLEEALNVCVAIATKYEADLEHYNNKLKEVNSKLKVSTVQAITW